MVKIFLCSHNTGRKEISARLYNKVLSLLEDKNNEIIKDGRGKPYLKNREFYFSVSHTESLGVIAISCAEVGIDAERADRKIRPPVAQRFLSGNDDISHWVHFEAFGKLTGEGISAGYSKLQTTPHYKLELEKMGHKICICSFVPIDDYSAEEF